MAVNRRIVQPRNGGGWEVVAPKTPTVSARPTAHRPTRFIVRVTSWEILAVAKLTIKARGGRFR